MKISAKYEYGFDFGEGSQIVYDTKVFDNIVDYERWRNLMEEFGDDDKVVSVVWDCR